MGQSTGTSILKVQEILKLTYFWDTIDYETKRESKVVDSIIHSGGFGYPEFPPRIPGQEVRDEGLESIRALFMIFLSNPSIPRPESANPPQKFASRIQI